MTAASDFTAGLFAPCEPYRCLADWLHIPCILACFDMMRLLLAMHTYPIAFLTPHMKSCASSSQLSHVDPPAVRPVWIHILQIWGCG